MKKTIKNGIAVAALVGLTPVVAYAWPWSTDMMNQPSIKPQEGAPYPFPERSIPVTGEPTKVADRQEAENLTNPVPADADSIKQGRILYKIYCAACHGLTGQADAPISPKVGAISLVDEYVQETLSEGWIWGTITFGSALMPAYGKPGEQGGANDMTPIERWHVVNYIKHALVKDAEEAAALAQQANAGTQQN